MSKQQTIFLPDIATLDSVAKQLATEICTPSWIDLQGDLGAGKTAFAKAFIQHKGCDERVTSPTYALMQDYHTETGVVIHCDLYRLAEPEELYEIGLLEQSDSEHAVVLVEWASKGQGVLPSPDMTLFFDIIDAQKGYRQLTITYHN